MDAADWANVGDVVRERRKVRDLTQKQAAIQADVSDTTWLTLESGKPVSERTLRRAAVALLWPDNWLIYALKGEQPPVVEPRGSLGGLTATIGGARGQGSLPAFEQEALGVVDNSTAAALDARISQLEDAVEDQRLLLLGILDRLGPAD